MFKITKSSAAICLFVTFLMLTSTLVLAAEAPSTRAGTTNNEPNTGYAEGAETVELFHLSGVHNTTYALGENITIRITSNIITALPGGSPNNNRVHIFDYLGVGVSDNKDFFIQTVATPPYQYNGTLWLNAANGFTTAGDYLITARLRQSASAEVFFQEVIHVGGSYAPQERYIKTYKDPAYTNQASVFSPTSTIYVDLWTGSTNSTNTTSTVSIQDYQINGLVGKVVSTLANPVITKNGNYSRFAFDLANDLGVALTLQDNYWYMLTVNMVNGTTIPVDQIVDWTTQFKVNFTMPSPPNVLAGNTTAQPAQVFRGMGSTNLSTNLTHANAPAVGNFKITYKVRSPTGVEQVLANNLTNGVGGMSVVQDAVDHTKYKALMNWAVPAGQELGLYDIYFKVDDGALFAEDGYASNLDELEIKNFTVVTNPPVIVLGATEANPTPILAIGTNTTTISVNFTDTDNSSADTFKVTFKLRAPDDLNITTLCTLATNGTSGMLVNKTGTGTYTATMTWDPPDNATLGSYDLYSYVEDANANSALDPFASNLDELVLTKLPGKPVIKSGNMTAVPSSINRTGNAATLLRAYFYHEDSPAVADLTVTFMVRDESGINFTLVDQKKHGVGGLSVLSLGSGNYTASYLWDPADLQPLGKYDLYLYVEDALGANVTDGFDSNLDELTLTQPTTTYNFTIQNVTASPDTVNLYYNETTTISTKFHHSLNLIVGAFKLTLKVRGQNSAKYTLLQGAGNGENGLSIASDALGNYTATYTWKPANDQALGTYDIHVSVIDQAPIEMSSDYDQNLEAFALINDSGVPPGPGPNVTVPPKNGTINGQVKGQDGTPLANATVSIYNATTGALMFNITVNATGKYSIELPPSDYTVWAKKPGYIGQQINVTLGPEEIRTLDFTLMQLPIGDDDIDDDVDDDVDDDTDDDTEEGGVNGLTIAIIIAFVLIVIAVTVFIIIKMRKKPEEKPEEETKTEPEETPEEKPEAEPGPQPEAAGPVESTETPTSGPAAVTETPSAAGPAVAGEMPPAAVKVEDSGAVVGAAPVTDLPATEAAPAAEGSPEPAPAAAEGQAEEGIEEPGEWPEGTKPQEAAEGTDPDNTQGPAN